MATEVIPLLTVVDPAGDFVLEVGTIPVTTNDAEESKPTAEAQFEAAIPADGENAAKKTEGKHKKAAKAPVPEFVVPMSILVCSKTHLYFTCIPNHAQWSIRWKPESRPRRNRPLPGAIA
jgi:hypothetical protein